LRPKLTVLIQVNIVLATICKRGKRVHKLVVIDLTNADISRFEEYERQAIALLQKYGARLELGFRSVDGMTETHVLYFPDTGSFDGFLSDPVRAALQADWLLTGAVTTVSDIHGIAYLS